MMTVLYTKMHESSAMLFYVLLCSLDGSLTDSVQDKEASMHQNHERDERDLMTCEEAANYLRLHPRTVGRLLTQGKLPGVKVGRQWRLRRTDLDAYLRGAPRGESTS